MAFLIDISGDIGGLQGVLQQAYDSLIVHSSELIGVSSAIAGLGTLFTVGWEICADLAHGRGVKIEALYRPIAIGICITLFPYVIALINGVMSPLVTGTAAMVNDSNQAVATLL